MLDNNNYIDDNKYKDNKTGVIHNLLGITNNELLNILEQHITTIKIQELKESTISINSFKDIQDLHRNIFDTIYIWAGELREVPIFKEDKETQKETEFLAPPRFEEGINFINNLLLKYNAINKSAKSEVSESLAQILISLNRFHPFREGNGRTQRLIIFMLAKEKDYMLDLDKHNLHNEYKEGTIKNNKPLLINLVYNNLKPIIKKQTQEEQVITFYQDVFKQAATNGDYRQDETAKIYVLAYIFKELNIKLNSESKKTIFEEIAKKTGNTSGSASKAYEIAQSPARFTELQLEMERTRTKSISGP